MKKQLPPLLIFLGIVVLIFVLVKFDTSLRINVLRPQEIANKYSPAPTSLPSPSPKPLTFEEINKLYGPCVHLPVLFYHHIQNIDVAKANGQQNLTVATDIFLKQMQYLKDKGYQTVVSNTLTDFFDKGTAVSRGSVILTFDDGYEDFYVNVLPILRQFGFRAVMAIPTGLVGNPGYLSWGEISEAANSGMEVVNHTWSHASMGGSDTSLIQREISTADSQLSQRGMNPNRVFVYPYGTVSNYAENYLGQLGYTLAFTTEPGSTQCKKNRFVLPRIRIGNVSLSAYGF